MLKEGYWADVVVFDPDAVSDLATYRNPQQYAKGAPFVFVNGASVIDGGGGILSRREVSSSQSTKSQFQNRPLEPCHARAWRAP